MQILRGRGCHNGQIRQRKRDGKIVKSLVSIAVAPYKPRPVNHEGHRQVLETDVMQDLVHGSLHKGTVKRDKGAKPALGHSGPHGDGMLFGDPHIKKA